RSGHFGRPWNERGANYRRGPDHRVGIASVDEIQIIVHTISCLGSAFTSLARPRSPISCADFVGVTGQRRPGSLVRSYVGQPVPVACRSPSVRDTVVPAFGTSIASSRFQQSSTPIFPRARTM